MAGVVPNPQARPAPGGAVHAHFVMVDGRVVFAVCVLLMLACLCWFAVLVSQGWRKWDEE